MKRKHKSGVRIKIKKNVVVKVRWLHRGLESGWAAGRLRGVALPPPTPPPPPPQGIRIRDAETKNKVKQILAAEAALREMAVDDAPPTRAAGARSKLRVKAKGKAKPRVKGTGSRPTAAAARVPPAGGGGDAMATD